MKHIIARAVLQVDLTKFCFLAAQMSHTALDEMPYVRCVGKCCAAHRASSFGVEDENPLSHLFKSASKREAAAQK